MEQVRDFWCGNEDDNSVTSHEDRPKRKGEHNDCELDTFEKLFLLEPFHLHI